MLGGGPVKSTMVSLGITSSWVEVMKTTGKYTEFVIVR